MEALMATLASFGVFVVGMLWQRAIGLVGVDGLWWKPGFYYTPGHTWINRQGAALQVGLDDLAQRVLVGAQAIVLPRPGEEVREGEGRPRGGATRQWLREEGARLAQFLEHNLGVAAADGGEFLFPAPSLLSDEQWAALTRAFLRPGRGGIETASGSGTLQGAKDRR